MKRTVQVNVKMTQDDAKLFKKAAEKRWPGAVLTNSGIVLALARIAARETLAKKKGRERMRSVLRRANSVLQAFTEQRAPAISYRFSAARSSADDWLAPTAL